MLKKIIYRTVKATNELEAKEKQSKRIRKVFSNQNPLELSSLIWDAYIITTLLLHKRKIMVESLISLANGLLFLTALTFKIKIVGFFCVEKTRKSKNYEIHKHGNYYIPAFFTADLESMNVFNNPQNLKTTQLM